MLLFLCKLEISIKRFFCNLFTSKPYTHTSTPLYDSMLKELQNIVEEIKSFKDQLHKDKELFIKYYIEGYELEEIAKTNKTNVTNLYSRLSRGRKKIKKTLNYKEI